MTRGSDGSCIAGFRVCCPDGIAEAVWDIRGNEGRNTIKHRAENTADPFFPVLGSHCPYHCFIDVDHEVFEFNGQVIVFDNGVNQLSVKALGRYR